MSERKYNAPVDKLLTYGDARNFMDWPDYLALGLTDEHIPELIALATDRDLFRTESEGLEIWGPIHAWRALAQLHAKSAVEPLMRLWDEIDDTTGIYDWVIDELPEVFASIGPVTIPPLSSYLADISRPTYSRVAAADSLEKIAEKYLAQRQSVIELLSKELARSEQVDETVNGFLVSDLLDLGAEEAAEVIKAAFYAKKVDLSIQGDWYDVRDELGLDPSVEVPGPDPVRERHPMFSDYNFLTQPMSRPRPVTNKKAKNKRKQEKKSRKINRKKK